MRYRVPAHVAWVQCDAPGEDAGVYAVDVGDGTPVVLKGTAELIWLVAAEGGDLPDDVDGPEGSDPATVRAEVVAFADRLVSLGLLEEDS